MRDRQRVCVCEREERVFACRQKDGRLRAPCVDAGCVHGRERPSERERQCVCVFVRVCVREREHSQRASFGVVC